MLGSLLSPQRKDIVGSMPIADGRLGEADLGYPETIFTISAGRRSSWPQSTVKCTDKVVSKDRYLGTSIMLVMESGPTPRRARDGLSLNLHLQPFLLFPFLPFCFHSRTLLHPSHIIYIYVTLTLSFPSLGFRRNEILLDFPSNLRGRCLC